MTDGVEEIGPIVGIPEGIREAQQAGRLVPFIGAGLSRLAGCPDWATLAHGVLKQIVEKGKLNFAQLEQMRDLQPRIKLSLAYALAKERGIELDVRQLLQRTGWQDDAKGIRAYRALGTLARRFVTTNYDEWLDTDISIPAPQVSDPDQAADASTPRKRKCFYLPREFTPTNLSLEDSVIHLHGSLCAPESLILTTTDYLRHYANDHDAVGTESENQVLRFLEHLFSTKTVLFVGYGLEELEILEYAILKAKTKQDAQPSARHYLLQGFFSHQWDLYLGLKTYFRNCGIQLIAFRRDERDYDELIDVLERFAREAPASAGTVLQEFAEMKRLLHA